MSKLMIHDRFGKGPANPGEICTISLQTRKMSEPGVEDFIMGFSRVARGFQAAVNEVISSLADFFAVVDEYQRHDKRARIARVLRSFRNQG